MNGALRTFGAALALSTMAAISIAGDKMDGGVYIRLGANLAARVIARNKKKDLTSSLRIDVLEP